MTIIGRERIRYLRIVVAVHLLTDEEKVSFVFYMVQNLNSSFGVLQCYISTYSWDIGRIVRQVRILTDDFTATGVSKYGVRSQLHYPSDVIIPAFPLLCFFFRNLKCYHFQEKD